MQIVIFLVVCCIDLHFYPSNSGLSNESNMYKFQKADPKVPEFGFVLVSDIVRNLLMKSYTRVS